jgi:ribosomal protein S18 acetylase RimI-like enzyme
MDPGRTAPRVAPLGAQHRDRVAEILGATGAFTASEIDVALELFDDGMESTESYELIGVFDETSALRGYACWGPTPGTDRGYDLYWIAVDPAAHGSGWGSTLMRAVEDRLRERDARLLVVETSSRSSYGATRLFYERRGYLERARVRGFYAEGDDRVIFTKQLQAGAGEEARHE